MSATILTVRAADYAELLAPALFSGLPREEIERLHGTLEVVAVARDEAALGSAYLQLLTLTAVHYNYSWLTFGAAPRSLGLVHQPVAAGPAPAFLDHAYQRLARRGVEQRLELPECEWRLVGLLHDAQLLLVYVARLRRAWREPRQRDGAPVYACGSGELRLGRGEFDARSQILIDHLDAF